MEEPKEDLDLSSFLCDEVAEELFRQWEEEEAAEKIQKGDFTTTTSSGATEAAGEQQKPMDTKCPKCGNKAPSRPPLSGAESADTCLPCTPRRRERIRINYTTDQAEILEAFYNEDSFPEWEKKKFIADSLGVTVKNISTWFQNRRARGRKDDPVSRKLGAGQSNAEHTPQHQISPVLPRSKRVSPSSTKMPPSRKSLLPKLSSPSQSREKRDRTSPLLLAALTGGRKLAHREHLYLPIDISSLFDLDSLTSSQQNSTYNLQISYNAIQPGMSLPNMTNRTPNPPNSNLTSYLIFGPEGKPSGLVTVVISAQSTDMQSSDQHAGTAAYQSHHGNRGPDEDQQPSSSISLPQPEVSLLQESSHENSLDSLLKEFLSSATTILSPVSAPPQRSCLHVEETPPEELLEPQVSATSPESPPVSHHFEVDYEKHDKIDGHFLCDVSPTHFSF